MYSPSAMRQAALCSSVSLFVTAASACVPSASRARGGSSARVSARRWVIEGIGDAADDAPDSLAVFDGAGAVLAHWSLDPAWPRGELARVEIRWPIRLTGRARPVGRLFWLKERVSVRGEHVGIPRFARVELLGAATNDTARVRVRTPLESPSTVEARAIGVLMRRQRAFLIEARAGFVGLWFASDLAPAEGQLFWVRASDVSRE